MPLEGPGSVSSKTWMPSSHSGCARRLDGVGQVAAVEVGVEAADELGLLPGEGAHAERASSGTSSEGSRPRRW